MRVENGTLVGECNGCGDIVTDICEGEGRGWLGLRRPKDSRSGKGGVSALFDVLAIPEDNTLGFKGDRGPPLATCSLNGRSEHRPHPPLLLHCLFLGLLGLLLLESLSLGLGNHGLPMLHVFNWGGRGTCPTLFALTMLVSVRALFSHLAEVGEGRGSVERLVVRGEHGKVAWAKQRQTL